MTRRGINLTVQPVIDLIENNIVRIDLAGIRHLELELVRFIHAECLGITGTSNHAVSLIATNVLTFDFEVQAFAGHPDFLSHTESLAIVGHSFMLRHLVSLLKAYQAPGRQVGLFDDEQAALSWLTKAALGGKGDSESTKENDC